MLITQQDPHIDNALLFRWKSGERKAFEELYRRYAVPLLEIAYRKTNHFESAEEIVQDVFLAFYNSREKVEDNPGLYLKGILKHKIFDYVRKGKVQILPLDKHVPSYRPQPGSDIYNTIFVKELDKEIRMSIDQLPAQCRTVFMMSRNEDLSYSEIAERLGISIKTVEAHISKALKYLRKHLEVQCFWLILFSHWIK